MAWRTRQKKPLESQYQHELEVVIISAYIIELASSAL